MEWGTFDLHSNLVVMPRGYGFTAKTPDNTTGLTWVGQYGFVGLDAPSLAESMFCDGMNEKGLAIGAFYLPGFTEYQPYDPALASVSMGPDDLIAYLLSTTASVAEARAALAGIRVTPRVSPLLGYPPPAHLMIVEPSGQALVVEYLKGELTLFDAPLGVITNAPTYDWHEINLRNYINLSPFDLPCRRMDELDFKPLGGGSGMIGLPGDFTPPSRFVRAVAFSQTARPTPTAPETIYELFRILDNFNVPLGAAVREQGVAANGMRSSTIWTTAWDTRNLILNYHTQNNRRVRRFSFNQVAFDTFHDRLSSPLDITKAQDVEEVTLRTT
jgi:choloylglycine hydrolase